VKYLIIVLLVVFVALQWRNARATHIKTRQTRDPDPNLPQDMVVCAHCGVHLPTQEAVSGNHGKYCDAQHRAAAER